MVHNSTDSAPALNSSTRRLSRKVSSPTMAKSEQQDSEKQDAAPSSPPRKRSRPASGGLTRQVSHDGLASLVEKENGRDSMEQNKTSSVSNVAFCDEAQSTKMTPNAPTHANPLSSRAMFDQHTKSLRLEADLHPMRLILTRLMSNMQFNRKGVFNAPVEPVALGLPDYFKIIDKPMDLGTVKRRLHSLEYHSRLEVAQDIRQTFRNAMLYNPAHNTVHLAAKALLGIFEDQIDSFCPELLFDDPPTSTENLALPVPVASSASRKVSMPLASETQDGAIARTVSTNEQDHLSAVASTRAAVASPPPVHTKSTRKSQTGSVLLAPVVSASCHRRKKRGAKTNPGHNCQYCHGNKCAICKQGCMALEPTLLICSGAFCHGAKIRRGGIYYIAPDGGAQYCQRCHTGLPAVLPQTGRDHDVICRYKRDLLKRRNDEDVMEKWITCTSCQSSVHEVCAMHLPFPGSSEDYVCLSCQSMQPEVVSKASEPSLKIPGSELFTFVAGSDQPVPMSNFGVDGGASSLSAEALPVTPVSAFIEAKVRDQLRSDELPNVEKTVTVRVISDCERFFDVPDIIRTHFRMKTFDDSEVRPPTRVHYRSKAITLFQKIDGLDVCIFCMYVHEYNGQDDFENDQEKTSVVQQKRVYIAYLDSVDHFRPRTRRTQVYQEILTAYLATARKRGYETAHIWACPPTRGNSFVFWNHPASQRTPNIDRLTSWYHAALSRSAECGVVTDVKSLYESDFEAPLQLIESAAVDGSDRACSMPCPPLLDGDFWLEESLRVHGLAVAKYFRAKADPEAQVASPETLNDPCPAVQVAAMLGEKLIGNPTSVAFRRPVNAAALKLKDYHKIVSRPMDLGTVHSKCSLGEYHKLHELVSDIDLVFSNAKKFNPPTHPVHLYAIELGALFLKELDALTVSWHETPIAEGQNHSWKTFADMSMSLGQRLAHMTLDLVDTSPILDNPATEKVIMSLPDDKSLASFASAKTSLSNDSSVEHLVAPNAIQQRMVGKDTWVTDKKLAVPSAVSGKKLKRKKSNCGESLDEALPPKRRRQSWLGEEVGSAVRRMRTSFFKCALSPSKEDCSEETHIELLERFEAYADCFKTDSGTALRACPIADARQGLLEFSQFRNLEFDTVRRAKYSSSVLLYHLHNGDAPGVTPRCTTCHKDIEGVRWHKITKVVEYRPPRVHKGTGGRRPSQRSIPIPPEELCSLCHGNHQHQDFFIPLPVSI